MTIWQILGIEPTKDVTLIKKAYAAQAALRHPEEHPEEYQELRRAYRAAMDHAAGRAVSEEANPDGPYNASSSAVPYEAPRQEAAEEFSYDEVERHGREKLEQEFFRSFSLLADNDCTRNMELCWACFLEREEYGELFSDEGFCQRLLRQVRRRRGWKRSTLERFEPIARECGRKRDQWLWERKKARGEHMSSWGCHESWRRLHEELLRMVERAGDPAYSKEAAGQYLQLYFAKTDGMEREQIRQRKREYLWQLVKEGCLDLLLGLAGIGLLYVVATMGCG